VKPQPAPVQAPAAAAPAPIPAPAPAPVAVAPVPVAAAALSAAERARVQALINKLSGALAARGVQAAAASGETDEALVSCLEHIATQVEAL